MNGRVHSSRSQNKLNLEVKIECSEDKICVYRNEWFQNIYCNFPKQILKYHSAEGWQLWCPCKRLLNDMKNEAETGTLQWSNFMRHYNDDDDDDDDDDILMFWTGWNTSQLGNKTMNDETEVIKQHHSQF